MPARKISIDNAKKEKLFYVVANVVVYRESDKRCLILKRDERETAHPGKYGVVGGKLEWGDLDINNPSRVNGDVLDYEQAIPELLKREAFEESGVTIDPELRFISSLAFIRPDETPVVLLKFAARYKTGEVVPEKGSFTDFAWVNAVEVKNYPCIDGIVDEVAEVIKLFDS